MCLFLDVLHMLCLQGCIPMDSSMCTEQLLQGYAHTVPSEVSSLIYKTLAKNLTGFVRWYVY